jgi:hypothetical protein
MWEDSMNRLKLIYSLLRRWNAQGFSILISRKSICGLDYAKKKLPKSETFFSFSKMSSYESFLNSHLSEHH